MSTPNLARGAKAAYWRYHANTEPLLSCPNCGADSKVNKFGYSAGRQRYRCECGRTFTDTPKGGNTLPEPKVNAVIAAFRDPGASIRKVMASTGVSKQSIMMIRRSLIEPQTCGCGEPQGHRGWCSFLYALSEVRQKYLATTWKSLPSWQRPLNFFIGFMRATEDDLNFRRVKVCSYRGCVFPAMGDASQCHRHEHFVEYAAGMKRWKIDRSDLYATDHSPVPLFSQMQGWELERSADDGRIRFLNKGNVDQRWRDNDAWWNTNVIKQEVATGNIQHTGAFILWKGFGKRKIRKSQRKRPAGWHGNHPEQKPMYKEIERESIAEWAPSGEAKPHVQHLDDELPTEYERYEIADDDYEREMAIAQIDDNFGFDQGENS